MRHPASARPRGVLPLPEDWRVHLSAACLFLHSGCGGGDREASDEASAACALLSMTPGMSASLEGQFAGDVDVAAMRGAARSVRPSEVPSVLRLLYAGRNRRRDALLFLTQAAAVGGPPVQHEIACGRNGIMRTVSRLLVDGCLVQECCKLLWTLSVCSVAVGGRLRGNHAAVVDALKAVVCRCTGQEAAAAMWALAALHASASFSARVALSADPATRDAVLCHLASASVWAAAAAVRLLRCVVSQCKGAADAVAERGGHSIVRGAVGAVATLPLHEKQYACRLVAGLVAQSTRLHSAVLDCGGLVAVMDALAAGAASNVAALCYTALWAVAELCRKLPECKDAVGSPPGHFLQSLVDMAGPRWHGRVRTQALRCIVVVATGSAANKERLARLGAADTLCASLDAGDMTCDLFGLHVRALAVMGSQLTSPIHPALSKCLLESLVPHVHPKRQCASMYLIRVLLQRDAAAVWHLLCAGLPDLVGIGTDCTADAGAQKSALVLLAEAVVAQPPATPRVFHAALIPLAGVLCQAEDGPRATVPTFALALLLSMLRADAETRMEAAGTPDVMSALRSMPSVPVAVECLKLLTEAGPKPS